MSDGLTHSDAAGAVRMVDVSDKPVTQRTATAGGLVRMEPATLKLVWEGDGPKGPVLPTARLAGIMAAKRTGELIPLCHPLPLSQVSVEFARTDDRTLAVTATCRTAGRTGVEMEAMTAVSVAALTVYDMVKAVDRTVQLDAVRLEAKSGGRSGDWRR